MAQYNLFTIKRLFFKEMVPSKIIARLEKFNERSQVWRLNELERIIVAINFYGQYKKNIELKHKNNKDAILAEAEQWRREWKITPASLDDVENIAKALLRIDIQYLEQVKNDRTIYKGADMATLLDDLIQMENKDYRPTSSLGCQMMDKKIASVFSPNWATNQSLTYTKSELAEFRKTNFPPEGKKHGKRPADSKIYQFYIDEIGSVKQERPYVKYYCPPGLIPGKQGVTKKIEPSAYSPWFVALKNIIRNGFTDLTPREYYEKVYYPRIGGPEADVFFAPESAGNAKVRRHFKKIVREIQGKSLSQYYFNFKGVAGGARKAPAYYGLNRSRNYLLIEKC